MILRFLANSEPYQAGEFTGSEHGQFLPQDRTFPPFGLRTDHFRTSQGKGVRTVSIFLSGTGLKKRFWVLTGREHRFNRLFSVKLEASYGFRRAGEPLVENHRQRYVRADGVVGGRVSDPGRALVFLLYHAPRHSRFFCGRFWAYSAT